MLLVVVLGLGLGLGTGTPVEVPVGSLEGNGVFSFPGNTGLNKICGRRHIGSGGSGRISGGADSHYAKWPWQISLKIREPKSGSPFRHHCGAVLLNSTWAVTAAHCVHKFILLGLGEVDISKSEDKFEKIRYRSKRSRVRSSVIHPKFNPTTFENDLALLELDEDVEFQPNIIPICLPAKGTLERLTRIGQMGHVTGWGSVHTGYKWSAPSSVLQETTVPIVSNAECESKVKPTGYVWPLSTAMFLCAGTRSESERGDGKGACWGDSGGPLVAEHIEEKTGDKTWVLIGVTSFGVLGFCGRNAPSAFTKISKDALAEFYAKSPRL